MKLEKLLLAGILSIISLSSCSCAYNPRTREQYEPRGIITSIDYYTITEIKKSDEK